MAISYTYDPEQLATSELFQVRFAVGDTEVGDAALRQLADQEIQYLIDQHGIVEGAAQAADRLAAKFARLADQKTGDLSTSYDQLQEHYRNLASSIRETGLGVGGGAVGTFVGGVSISEDETFDNDTDRKPNLFDKGMHDNPRGSISGTPELRRTS